MSRDAWTVDRLLLNWGLVTAGGRLQDVIRKMPTGETQAEDDEQIAFGYVQTTPGYFRALPVLRFVYVLHGDPAHFDPRQPGESLLGALKRLEWTLLEGLHSRDIGPVILDEFKYKLAMRCKREPLVYHAPHEPHVLPMVPANGDRTPLRRKFA